RRRHTRSKRDWSSDVCSSDLKNRFSSYGSCSNIMNIPVVNAVKLIKSYRNSILSGEMTMPTYKKGIPINIRATDIRPVEEDECRSEERRVGKEVRVQLERK